MNKTLRLWLSIAISLLFLYLACRKIDFYQIGSILKGINYILVFPAIIIHVSNYWFRGIRWKYLLSSIRLISPRKLFPIISIGYMANNLLPMRLGEFARAYGLGKKEDISKSSILGTILVERIFDGLTLLFLWGIIAFALPPADWVKKICYPTAIFFVSILIFCTLLLVWQQNTVNIVTRLLSICNKTFSERITKLLSLFIDGFKIFHRTREIFLVFFYSMVAWLLEFAIYYGVALAFNLNLSIVEMLFVMIIINLGLIIPSSPGYVGTFEFFGVLSLGLFRVPEPIALSYTLIVHAAVYLPITLIGIAYLGRENISFKEIEGLVEIKGGEKYVA